MTRDIRLSISPARRIPGHSRRPSQPTPSLGWTPNCVCSIQASSPFQFPCWPCFYRRRKRENTYNKTKPRLHGPLSPTLRFRFTHALLLRSYDTSCPCYYNGKPIHFRCPSACRTGCPAAFCSVAATDVYHGCAAFGSHRQYGLLPLGVERKAGKGEGGERGNCANRCLHCRKTHGGFT